MKVVRLEEQADGIEELLSAYEIPAQVTGGTITHNQVQLWLWPRLGTFTRIKALRGELAALLRVTECQVSRWRVIGAQIEIPRKDDDDG